MRRFVLSIALATLLVPAAAAADADELPALELDPVRVQLGHELTMAAIPFSYTFFEDEKEIVDLRFHFERTTGEVTQAHAVEFSLPPAVLS